MGNRIRLLLWIAALACIVLTGCKPAIPQTAISSGESAPRTAVDQQVDDLLARYSLETSGLPEERSFALPSEESSDSLERVGGGPEAYLDFVTSASKEIGLDPTPWREEGYSVLDYLLKRETLAGPVHAVFFVADGKVVGACLAWEGYAPGIEDLRETVPYAPTGLTTERLQFVDVDRVEIARTMISKGVPLTVKDGREILDSIAHSRPTTLPPVFPAGTELAWLRVRYVNGMEVEMALVRGADGALFIQLPYDSFARRGFAAPRTLERRAAKLLRS